MKGVKIDPDEAEKLRASELTEEEKQEQEEKQEKAKEQLRKMRMDGV